MQCIETETLLTLIIREKFDGTSQSDFKDRIESFDDYYPCMQMECDLFHVHNWIQFFVSMYNDTIANNSDDFELGAVNIILN